MFTAQNFLNQDEEEKFKAGRVLPHEEIALKIIFSRQDKFMAGYDRFMNSFRHLRGAPPRLSPRKDNVQALYFSANIWKLPPPARARAGIFFIMPERVPAPAGPDGTRIYTYRKNINHDFGSGAFACGQRKTPPAGAIIVKPSQAKNILRPGDAARHCRYILRLPPAQRGPDKNTENMCDDADIFADDLVFRAARGGCDDPTYWTMKEKSEKAGARHQWRLIVALPNNFVAADFARFAEAFDEKTAAWQLSYVLAVHAKKSAKTGAAPNQHAHILISDRNAEETATGYIFDGQKNRALARPGMVRELRQICADSINIALEARDAALRVTAESYAARGRHRLQAKHLGSRAHQIELRGGITEVGDHNRALAFDERLAILPKLQEKIIAKTMRERGKSANQSLRRILVDHARESCKLAIFNWNMAELLKQQRRMLQHQQQKDPSILAATGLLENYVSKRRSSMVVVYRFRRQTLAQSVAAQKMREQAQAERKQKILEKLLQKPLLTQNLSQQALMSPKVVATPSNHLPPISVAKAPAPVAHVIQPQPSATQPQRAAIQTHSDHGSNANTPSNLPQLQVALFQLYLVNQLWKAQNSKSDESEFDAANKVLVEKRATLWRQHDEENAHTLQTLLVDRDPRIVAKLMGSVSQRPCSFLELDQLFKNYIKPTETTFLCGLFDYLNTSLAHWQRIDRDTQAQILVDQLHKKQRESWLKTLKNQKATSHKLAKDAIIQLREYWSPALMDALDQLLPGIGEPITKCLYSPTLTSNNIAALVQTLQKQQNSPQLFRTAIQTMTPLLREKRTHPITKLARSVIARVKYLEEERLNLVSSYEVKVKDALTAPADHHQRNAASRSLTIESQGGLLETMSLLGIGSDPHFGRPAVFDSLDWFSRSISSDVPDRILHDKAKELFRYLYELDDIWRAAEIPGEQEWKRIFISELETKIASIEQHFPKQQATTWQSWQAIKAGASVDLSIMCAFDPPSKIAALKEKLDAKLKYESGLEVRQALKQARDATDHLYNIVEQKARAKAVEIFVSGAAHNWQDSYQTMTYHWPRKSPKTFDQALDKAQKCAEQVKALSEKSDFGRRWFTEYGQNVVGQLLEVKIMIDWKYRDWSEAMCKVNAQATTPVQAKEMPVSRRTGTSLGPENRDRYRPIAERLREQKERL
jgi:hypothetical protein